MSDLVIDADILRASGTSEHPFAKNARIILEQIRERGHRFVQTPSLKAEHDKHQSRFAQRWRVAMISRKQWIHRKPSEDCELRQHLVRAQSQDATSDEQAVLKDTHLLEAAAAADLQIISKDTTAKQLFKKGCPLPQPYGRIIWADVTLHPDETVEWVEQGCPQRTDWQLCP